MRKVFNVTAACIPEQHYMVNLDGRLKKIKGFVDEGKYFIINRARQYGKTTTLMALEQYLRREYYIVSMDFQTFGSAEFENENTFSVSFGSSFLRLLKRNMPVMTEEMKEAFESLKGYVDSRNQFFTLKILFEEMSEICRMAEKPVVLMIDEIDSASNNQVFLDFLAQLRAYYIRRATQSAFRSVILAGVYDIKNLRQKLRPEDEHKMNSPWNIAADFNIDMSFSEEEIGGMLEEYEADFHTGMNVSEMAGELYAYTSGYPFLVSRLCKLMDEEICGKAGFVTKDSVWTKAGVGEAVKMILTEKNTLFESLSEKLESYSELKTILRALLFTGRSVVYNIYDPSINIAAMFGFVKDQNGMVAVANRIFEMWLYNMYLSASEMQKEEIYTVSLQDKNQFLVDGHLNMKRVLEKFAVHFNDLYERRDESFLEEEGRKYFLLYLKPIINGTGNYYIESRTRELRRTDIVVDYRGERFVIEMKIWHGEEYNRRGEKQLIQYLEDYHLNKGYMVSFNFNKSKQSGVHEIVIGEKVIIEAVI